MSPLPQLHPRAIDPGTGNANKALMVDAAGTSVGYGTVPDAETIRDTVAAFIKQGANVTVTHDDAADTLTIAAAGGSGGSGGATGGGSLVADRKVSTGLDVPVSSTVWVDVDNTLDLSLPAAAGDVLEIYCSTAWNDAGSEGHLNVATVVAGAVVNYVEATGTKGITNWWGRGNVLAQPGGPVQYVVQAADLELGAVLLRLRTRIVGAVTKTLLRGTGFPMRFAAVNLTRSTVGGAGNGAFGRMSRNSDQPAIVANTATKVTFTHADRNAGSIVDLANSRFVAPVTGSYIFSHVINLGGDVPTAYSYLYINGTPLASATGVTLPVSRLANGNCLVAAFPINLTAGDVVEVYVVSSASVTIRGSFPSWAELAALDGGTGPAAGSILATAEATASATYSTSVTTDADVDATNLKVTFTFPASGKVQVELAAVGDCNAPAVDWTLRSGGATVAACTMGAVYARSTAHFRLTGTPGSTATYTWGFRRNGASGTPHIYTGGAAGTFGNAMMTVTAL